MRFQIQPKCSELTAGSRELFVSKFHTVGYRKGRAPKPAANRLFCRYRGSHLLNHCWKSYTGYRFANANYKLAVLTYKIRNTSTPAYLSHHIRHRHLGNPHVTSVLQPHHYSTDRLPELTSPTTRSVALNTDTLCCNSLALFKHNLKTFLFRQTFSPGSSRITRL